MNQYVSEQPQLSRDPNNMPYLVCKRVAYYGLTDEELFFHWISLLSSVHHIDGDGDELYLVLKSDHLNEQHIMELLAFFKRYAIDMEQIRPLLNKTNQAYFMKKKGAFWYEPLFGADDKT